MDEHQSLSSMNTTRRAFGAKVWFAAAIIALLLFGGTAFAFKSAYDTRLAQISQQTAEQTQALKQELAADIRTLAAETRDLEAGGGVTSSQPPDGEPDAVVGERGPSGSPGVQGASGQDGQDGIDGADGTNGAQGPQGEQGLTGPQGPSGVASCPNGPCLSAQAATPGVQEAGHINIAGKAIIGSGINSTTGDFSGDVTANNLVASGQVSALSFLQNGNIVCDDSNNCGYATSAQFANVYQQGGNSFGAAAAIGTNDNFGIDFETNGTTKMTILANGNVGVGTGSPGDQILSVAGGVYVDYLSQNYGNIDKALRFGNNGSGQGIGSKQTAGGNQYGLDFYTGYVSRLSITNSGSVMIASSLTTGGITLSGTSHLIGNGDTRGQVTVTGGTTSATYNFATAYASAPNVVVTPTSNPGAHYWVSNVTTTGFTVNISAAPAVDTVFNFQAQQ